MTVLFPQWQGSGRSNEIEVGSHLLGEYFSDILDHEIQLINDEYHIRNDVIFQITIFEQLKRYRDILDKIKPENLTTIGGDCGIEIIPVSYLNNMYEKMGILWLDAHADLNTPDSSPSKTFHGMPLRLLFGDGDIDLKNLMYSTVKPKQLFYFGIRDIDVAEKDYIEENFIFHTQKISYDKLRTKLQACNIEHLYVHLDLDVIKPSEYKYVKCPTKGGISIREIELLIFNLQNDFRIVGYCICESTARDINSLAPIENILKLIKKGTMHNNRYKT
jgi:arginase